MKNFKIFVLTLFLSLILFSCNSLQPLQKDSIEVELAKTYAVHKLQQVFGVKIDVSRNFKGETQLPITRLESIFGKGLTQKFTDTLSVIVETQKVKSSFIYIKKDSLSGVVKVDRLLKD